MEVVASSVENEVAAIERVIQNLGKYNGIVTSDIGVGTLSDRIAAISQCLSTSFPEQDFFRFAAHRELSADGYGYALVNMAFHTRQLEQTLSAGNQDLPFVLLDSYFDSVSTSIQHIATTYSVDGAFEPARKVLQYQNARLATWSTTLSLETNAQKSVLVALLVYDPLERHGRLGNNILSLLEKGNIVEAKRIAALMTLPYAKGVAEQAIQAASKRPSIELSEKS